MAKKVTKKPSLKVVKTKSAPHTEVPLEVEKAIETAAADVAKDVAAAMPLPAEAVEHVEKLVKKGGKEDEIKMYMRSLMEEFLPAMSVSMASAMANANPAKAAAERIKRWHVCNECRQKGPPTKENPLGSPCRGRHIYMIVYPTRQPQFGKWFQGVFINGVRYLSDNRRQKILVPADNEGQIQSIIENWEQNELDLRIGKTVEHDSGGIREGGGTAGFKPAVAVGWR